MARFRCDDTGRTTSRSRRRTRREKSYVLLYLSLAGLWLLIGNTADLQAQTGLRSVQFSADQRAVRNEFRKPLVELLPLESASLQVVLHTDAASGRLPGTRDSEFGPSGAADRRSPSAAEEFSSTNDSDERFLQLLPDGLLYKSYLAGEKEPRFRSVWLYERGRGWIWEPAVGGRVGLIRYGTRGAINPQGWQLDLEGAAFPRIDPVEGSQLDAIDVRAGMVATWRSGPTAVKAGYYHISSHVGDEFLLRNPGFVRIEYVRDSAILGLIHNLTPDVAVYGEIGYAIGAQGGAKPLEFQFGAEFSPAIANGLRGTPFAAVNGHLREDFDFSGSINVVAGWQWRGPKSGRLFRAGFQYYNGQSLQYQFFDKHEELIGLGIWFDY